MKNTKRVGILLLFALVAVLTLSACGKKKNEPFTYRGPSEKKQEKVESKEETTEYIIKEVNMEEETITAVGEQGGLIRCSYNLSTRFLDKYGDSCSSVHFTPGQVIRLGERNEKSVVESVQLSDTVWKFDDVKNYDMDMERGVFSIGESNYRITNKTLVFSGDMEATFADIGKDDVLQVIGRDKDIISVMVTTGHGYIQLVNTELFQDSMVCIGNRIFTMITGDMRIEVSEGTYPLTVANKGYGGTQEVTVVRNETAIVDLDQLKGAGPKMCKLTLETDIVGAAVYIDGKQITVGETIEVTYGAHRLAIVAEGYESWEKTLVVNSESATISLDMEEEKSETEQQSSGNGNTTNSNQNNSNNNTNNTGNNQSSGSNKSDKSELSDTEVDYLTTISNMLTNILKN